MRAARIVRDPRTSAHHAIGRTPSGATGRGLARGLAGAVVAVVAGAAVLLGTAGSATAHDFLVSTNPTDGATVSEALTTVSLTFNEPPLTQSGTAIAIEVHDPSGDNVASGPVSIVNSTLSVAVAPDAQGDYTVLWQTVSADGHPVSGQFGFSYAGPAAGGDAVGAGGAGAGTGSSSPASSPGQDAGAAAGSGQSTGSPTATPGAGQADGSGSAEDASGSGGVQVPYLLIGLGAAGGVIVIVAIVLVVGLRRRAR